MSESAVALTDYLLLAECVGFAAYLRRSKRSLERSLWLAFFSSTGVAALTGGTYHGFFPGQSVGVGGALWLATLLAIGVTGFAELGLAARLRFSAKAARACMAAGGALLAVYVAVVVFGSRPFIVAIVYYAPAGLFWLTMLILEHRERSDRASLLGAAGVAASFLAAAVQMFRASIASLGLDHNSLYHLIQAAGLALLFACAVRQLAASSRVGGR